MEGTCMELALEGERLCKAGDCRTGVEFFEAAVRVGTDDIQTLSAIYSQLGNAYFCLQEYGKALEYHRHDLNLTRSSGDKLGEAKASGNLGNTLKVLEKFDEAIVCCQRYLDIAKDLTDRVEEARALYNLGNVYHAKGKHLGRNGNQDPGKFPAEVSDLLLKAVEYYEENLAIVRSLGDRAAQGRACGNLGNTHYLIGNFNQARICHEERLSIAKEFGDKSAERRAYSNLANAHIFLGEFEIAAEHYKKTLQIAIQLGDRALEAQACYSLGNTYTLLRDYPKAIEYHLRHLRIAQDLRDRVGEGRACWSLGNAQTALGNHEKALQYANKHLEISKEIGDATGQATAQMNLADLKTVLGINSSANISDASFSSIPMDGEEKENKSRRRSMENLELVPIRTPDKAKELAQGGARPKVQKAATIASNLDERMKTNTAKQPTRPSTASLARESKAPRKISPEMTDDDNFFDLLSKFQGRRMDEQRCAFDGPIPGDEDGFPPDPSNKALSQGDHDFLDMVAGIQGSRMNEQRTTLENLPGLHNSKDVIGQLLTNKGEAPDDAFFEMLMRCQGSRIEEQRSALPTQSAPTVPDEDFFSLITRLQGNRLDKQRTDLPPKRGSSKKKKKDKEKK
ncbi:unnamed protein product [Owenia fusiformis]|uniref:G-protein-signaling modulator 2 n=1 Tax=Owenia fusiformis TaxID=6347 RepID=A0A8S4P303_OWEFU|nr:unnamed protein product [Owenia fusiformis]